MLLTLPSPELFYPAALLALAVAMIFWKASK